MASAELVSLQSFRTILPTFAQAKGYRAEGGSLCPDLVYQLEPGESDDGHVQRIGGSAKAVSAGASSACWWPTCAADLLPSAAPATANVSCGSCAPCGHPSTASDKPLKISVEILTLVVLEDGFTVLPRPQELAILDPRTWFTWRPVVEMLGTGAPLTTVEGRPSAAESQIHSGEGHWVGLTFPDSPEGSATVVVSSAGMLRFRILRARTTLGSRHTEQAFKANLDVTHDFVAQGCPERLVRPVFWSNKAGDIRHVGQLHIRVRQSGTPSRKDLPSISKVPRKATARAPRVMRVPEDCKTVQAAVDALLPAAPGDCRIVLSAGTHDCGTLYIRKPLTLEGCNDGIAILQANVIVESGGEAAEIRRLQIEGSLAVRAGTPVITGCTVVEAGSRPPASALARKVALGGIDVSGRGVRPHVEGNTVRAGAGPGILVHDAASGMFTKNTVIGNSASGFEVRDPGTKPTVERNKLLENKHHGLFVHSQAGGVFRDNDVHRNMRCGIVINGDGTGLMPVVTGNRVHENEQGGILVQGPMSSAISDNEELGPPRPPHSTEIEDHRTKHNGYG